MNPFSLFIAVFDFRIIQKNNDLRRTKTGSRGSFIFVFLPDVEKILCSMNSEAVLNLM